MQEEENTNERGLTFVLCQSADSRQKWVNVVTKSLVDPKQQQKKRNN